MKKKSLILMFALAGLFVSCNDAIDIKQIGQVTDPSDIYRNGKDIERGVYGVYSYLPGETEIEFVSTFTDELALGQDNGGQGLIEGEYSFSMQAGNKFARSIWQSYYAVMNRTNRLIHEIDRLSAEPTTEDDKGIYIRSKAELLVLRAYANYKLFAYFTPDYSNPSGRAIMKFDFLQTNDYSVALGRSTVSEIKDFILADLTKAEQVLASGSLNFRDNLYVNQGLIHALRTKTYLLVGDYANVITSGEKVFENPSYRLANSSEYTQYFDGNTGIGSEIIFQLARFRGASGDNTPAVASVASAWYSTSVSPSGSAFYQIGRSLYNELDKLDPSKTGQSNVIKNNQGEVVGFIERNDVRYGVNLLAGSDVNPDYATVSQSVYDTTDILYIGKYKGKPSENAPLQNNIPVMRAADVYLSIAEARAAQGAFSSGSNDPDELLNSRASVQSIIYTIRFNRAKNGAQVVVPPAYANAQEAYKAILDERRVEFAFEGHRYLDMKRLGVKSGSQGFERYSKDCVKNSACNLSVNDHRMTLPIPTAEMNANSTIRSQQNPGY